MEGENSHKEESCNFITRVAGLPVVQSVVGCTMGVYVKAKETNVVVKYTMLTAEKTFLVAAENAKPVIVKLERPINFANNLACKSLDKLEASVPMIKSTPEEILAETKKLYDETIIQPALSKYNNAKLYGVEKATAVKDYGVAKANLLLDTKYGHMLSDSFDDLLVKADGCMDTYLPRADCGGHPEEPTMNKEGPTAEKMVVLTKKVHQRMACHAVIKFQAAKKRTDEVLSNLHFTVDLIHMARTNVDQTNKAIMERLGQASDKVVQLWEKFNKGNPNEPGDKTLEQKLLFVASQLTEQLNKTYNKLASTLALLPTSVQPKIKMVQDYITTLYTQFSQAKSWNDISAVVLVQAKDATKHLQVLSANIYDHLIQMSPISRLVKANHDERKVIHNGSVGCNSTDASPAESAEPQTNAIMDNSSTDQNYCHEHDPSNSSISQ